MRFIPGSITLPNLGVVSSLEEALVEALAKIIKNTGYKYADDLIYGLSALADHDLWGRFGRLD